MSTRSALRAKKHATEKKKGWGCLFMALVPVCLMAGLIGLSWANGGGPNLDQERHENPIAASRLAAVSDVISEAGGRVREITGGSLVVEIPTAHAMTITSRQAMELALSVKSRTGNNVKVVSPQGQVLAETP